MRIAALLILGTTGILALAQPAERSIVAKSTADSAALLRREEPGKPWKLVGAKEDLKAGDLLVAGNRATIDSTNGAVRLVLEGGIASAVPLPILESAVVLNDSRDVDLDFTLLRGRVDLINGKAKGDAKVQVHGRGDKAVIRLLEPGTQVALVLAGRWPPGVPFRKDTKPEEHRPSQLFLVLVIKGEIEIKTAKYQIALQAQDGPALVEGDDVGEIDPAPRRLDKLPDWVQLKPDSEETKKGKAALNRFREVAKKNSVVEVLDQLLQSDDLAERRVALALLGATDGLERLAQTLAKASTPDAWDNSVPVIRHWIGREPGQDAKLYRLLIDKQKFTASQAETVMQLLHGFSDDALAQPETYEGLLDLMDSEQLAIRGLAHWHLYRLVPPGRKIGYHPLATAEKRTIALQEWRRLIPAGKLPPSK